MNLFEFANPIAWWAALLTVPIVLLYVLRTRMRRQRVATLLFWDRIFDEKRPRAWWQQLRRLLSLLLQLLILLLLVAALVDPLWSWQERRQRRVVLVIDNSASMRAVDEDGTARLDLATQAARGFVRSLRGNDQMAIITAGSSPRVSIGMTDHHNSLMESIAQLPSTDGPTFVLPAVAMAERLLSDLEGKTEILVLTDGCFDVDDKVASNPRVKLHGIGTPLENVGITRYQVRRSLVDSVGYQVLVDVSNFSETDTDCRLELNLGGELVDVLPLKLAPGETATRVVDHTSREGGTLVATLDVEDALAVDDTAYALLPGRDPIPVVLVSKGNLFLQSVLQSIPLVQLTVITDPPKAAPRNGILVIDRDNPQQIPGGNVLVVDPQTSSNLWTLSEPIAEPIVATVDADSPLTQHVRLTNVLFPKARRIEFSQEPQPLIRDPLDHTLFARIPRRGGDVAVLTCNLDEGDLPLRIAFPVLMKNTIEWFHGVTGELKPAAASGEMVTVSLEAPHSSKERQDKATDTANEDVAVVHYSQAAPVKNFLLVSPSAREYPISTTENEAIVGPLLETGLWTIRSIDLSISHATTEPQIDAAGPQPGVGSTDEALLSIACNLTNRRESDLRTRIELADIGELRAMMFGGHSLWLYLTVCGIGLLTIEWWLYQRRVVE